MNWSALLGVNLGGTLGSVTRQGLSQWLGSVHPELNMRTLAVNTLGGWIIGLWLTLKGNNPVPNLICLILTLNSIVGFDIMGFYRGLTTFSAFGMDLKALLQHKE